MHATNVTGNKVLGAHNLKEAFELKLILNKIIQEGMGYCPSVRSRWLFFACLWTETESSPNKLGQKRIYYMAFGEIFLVGNSE